MTGSGDFNNVAPPQETNPLVLAIAAGDAAAVAQQLQEGASPDCNTYIGYTALGLAAKLGHVDIVTLLVEAGANVNRKSTFGKTALMEIADDDLLGDDRSLLEDDAALDSRNKVFAARLPAARELIRCGADLEITNNVGWTALTCAVYYGYPPLAALLIEVKADVTVCNSRAETLLMTAANSYAGTYKSSKVMATDDKRDMLKRGRTRIAAMLIAAGVSLDAKDERGMTAERTALGSGVPEIAHMIKAIRYSRVHAQLRQQAAVRARKPGKGAGA